MSDSPLVLDSAQADTLLRLTRLRLLLSLSEPRTTQDLAATLMFDPDKVKYHLDSLLRVGLVEEAGHQRGRRVLYRRIGDSYQLPPALFATNGRGHGPSPFASLLEPLQNGHTSCPDGSAAFSGTTAAAVSADADLTFLFAELQQAFKTIAAKYSNGSPAGSDRVNIVMTCQTSQATATHNTSVRVV